MSSVTTYGSYVHTDNEVNLVTFSTQTRYSPRNKRLSQTKTLSLWGELIYSSTASIISKINEVEQAYSQDYLDFRYTVGGSEAHTLLNSSNCISGVKVLQRSFPKGDPSQLATTRSFSVTLQATYDVSEVDLVSWTESIRTIGTGGPKFFVVETIAGPIAIYVTLNSAQYYSQQGMAVGYSNYISPPGPVNTAGEFQDRRVIDYISGRNMGQALRFFTTKWSYYMGRDIGQYGTVDYRPISQ